MAVIASNTGGTKEVIIDGENGFLFPAGDTVALGGIITRLVDDRDLCVRVGQAARATVKKRYRIEHLVDHIESETVKELVLVRLHQPPEPRGLAGNRAFRGADNFTAAPSEGGERPWPSWKRLTHWRGI
jgi:hypothetical protein